MATIGAQIRKARQRKRMTQDELAKAVGVDRSAVSTWERGVHYPQRYEGAIEDILDIDLSGGTPGLPPEVEAYWYVPGVQTVWNLSDDEMPRDQRLKWIRAYIRDHPGEVRQQPPRTA